MAGLPPEDRRVIHLSVDVYVTLALITIFAYLSLQILSPFVSVLLWAIVLSVAIHPLFEKLAAAIGGRSGLAATIIAIAALMLVLVPAFFVAESIVQTLGNWARVLRDGDVVVPPPAEAVRSWPLVGGRIFEFWSAASNDLQATLQHFAPQLEKAALFMLATGAGLAGSVLQFALAIVFAAMFLAYAAPLTLHLERVASRVASERGRTLLSMAGATIRNVSRGILGVAVIQGGLASIGILVAGLPFAGFLSAAAIAACTVQVPILVILPTIIYVWSAQSTTVALIFTLYMIPVLLSDNVLKPILMAKGLETPMVVILIGVIGGTITNGLMGLFIGPVVLALFYKLVITWVAMHQAPDEAAAD